MLLVNGRTVWTRGHFLPPHPTALEFFPTHLFKGWDFHSCTLCPYLRREACSWAPAPSSEMLIQYSLSKGFPSTPRCLVFDQPARGLGDLDM